VELGGNVYNCVAPIAIVVNLTISSASRSGRTDQRLTTIDGRLTGVEGALKVFQAQITAAKYSAVPPKEL